MSRDEETEYGYRIEKEILRLLERNARLSAEEIGVMAGRPADEVQKIIRELENEQVICGYHTLINWNKEEEELVTALVELKVTPQGGDGYNKIAEQIYQYPQVETLYLMSGAYDFLVELKGKTIKEISMFVSENLASMDEVQSTATYFTLTKYKEQGVNLIKKKQDGRMVITP